MFKSHILGTGGLNGGLYRLKMNEFVSVQIEFDENVLMSTYVLWSRKLGCISQQRLKRVVKDGIFLSSPDNLEAVLDVKDN